MMKIKMKRQISKRVYARIKKMYKYAFFLFVAAYLADTVTV